MKEGSLAGSSSRAMKYSSGEVQSIIKVQHDLVECPPFGQRKSSYTSLINGVSHFLDLGGGGIDMQELMCILKLEQSCGREIEWSKGGRRIEIVQSMWE